MIIPKLALRNLLGAGLRTWLNVVVLSLSFVLIIWLQGLYKGMGDQRMPMEPYPVPYRIKSIRVKPPLYS
jgi:hypothetical protein